jgi:chemotaxis signal transduction protein
VREQRTRTRAGAHEGVILFTVSGCKFAVAASSVKEIRGRQGLRNSDFPGVSAPADKLRYTLERSGVTYSVVDAARHFGLPPSGAQRILILRNSPVALLVDSTDRMVNIFALHALPRAFTGEERLWYRGLAVIGGEVVPVVNTAAFLSKSENAFLRGRPDRLEGVTAV